MEEELRALAEAARSASGVENLNTGEPSSSGKKKNKKKKKKESGSDKNHKARQVKGGSAAIGSAGMFASSVSKDKTRNKKTTANERKRRKKAKRSSAQENSDATNPKPAVSAAPVRAAPKKHVFFGDREETTDKYESTAHVPASADTEEDASLEQPKGILGHTNADSALWFDNAPPELSSGKHVKAKVSFQVGKKLEDKAQELWDAEVEAYQVRKGARKGSSDSAWLRTVMRNGTLSDRIAAMSMVVQESAIHNFSTLTGLVAMTRKRGSREAHLAIEAVRDLFANQLLPDRKLRLFHNNPLGDTENTTSAHLIFWRFEAALAEKYSEYIQSLEDGAQEALPYFKRSCIQAMHELLMKKPEKEKRLLAMLVNKLGDPDRKIGANVVFLLQQLIREHPGMKGVIVDELEALIFRGNVSLRAQFYSLVFMTEIPLVRGTNKHLAKRMIKLYIRMFKVISDEEREAYLQRKGKGTKDRKKKARYSQGRNGKKRKRSKDVKNSLKSGGALGNPRTKLVRALLQGINRAFVYAECDGSETAEMTDILFRMVHHAPFATSVQALMLLLHVMVARNALSRRFYSTLYAKLFDGQLRSASKHTMFLNVVFKSMKIDTESKRVLAFAKRLLQTCLSMGASFTCGVLFLLSEVAKSQPRLRKAIAGVGGRMASGGENSDGGLSGEDDAESIDSRDINATYDATKRDPLHAHAEKCKLWELTALADHFHPSVRQFVHSLVTSPHKIVYAGDPLLDFSNPAFLERFSYRNPRQKDLTTIQRQSGIGGGSSTMRPLVSGRFGRTSVANPVNSKDFVQLKRESVRPEEVFFHDFFRSKQQRDRRLGVHKASNGEDDEENGEAMETEYGINATKFSDSEDEAELESYSQSLAESIMEDDLEDPDEDEDPVFDWSDDSEDDGAEGELIDGEAPVGAANDSEDEDESDEDDSDEEASTSKGPAARGSGGGKSGGAIIAHDTFASAEEFADILEASGDSGNKHQIAWERRNDWMQRSGRNPKKRRKYKR